MDLGYWYLLPIGVAIATIANGAGVGGATFFSPLFVLVLGLEPKVAVGTALITEVFGFASGVAAHARARTIDWRIAGLLAAVSIPAAIVGSLVGGAVNETVLKIILGVGLLAIAAIFVRHHDRESEDAAIADGKGVVEPSEQRLIVARDGERISYRLCRTRQGRLFSAIGGLFVGMISTGLGELNSYTLVKRCRVPSRVTVATGVVVVAVTALAAGITHLIDFVGEGQDVMSQVASLVIFTVPGVIIGGQLGPQLVRRVDGAKMVRALGWLFLAIGIVTIVEAV